MTDSNNDILEINVGGRIFTSLRGTFCKEPNSMLCELFESPSQQAKDPSGRIFVDSDSDYFEYVLFYLRRGPEYLEAVLKDLTPVQRKRLLMEAQFYRLHGLVDILEQEISKEQATTMDQVLNENEVIDINVGGRIFTCPRATLSKYRDSMLGAMFDPDSPFKTHTKDPSGRIYINRNGDLFAHVLDFLRHDQPEHLVDLTPWERNRLLEEAEYYSLQGLVGLLKMEPKNSLLDIVEVNVKGRVFIFPGTTVTEKAPDSMLARIITGAMEWPKDLHGRPFIDRSPLRFECIIETLRRGYLCTRLAHGTYCDTTRDISLFSLLEEAEYFGMDKVARMCSEYLLG